MFAIIHILLGSLIGLNLNSIILIILLSLASHFLLDVLPHWDGTYEKKLFQSNGKMTENKPTFIIRFIDFSLAFIIIVLLYLHFNSKLLVLGALVAVLPDIAKIGYLTSLKNKKFYIDYLKFHSKIQGNAGFKLGLIIQAIILIIILLLLL